MYNISHVFFDYMDTFLETLSSSSSYLNIYLMGFLPLQISIAWRTKMSLEICLLVSKFQFFLYFLPCNFSLFLLPFCLCPTCHFIWWIFHLLFVSQYFRLSRWFHHLSVTFLFYYSWLRLTDWVCFVLIHGLFGLVSCIIV